MTAVDIYAMVFALLFFLALGNMRLSNTVHDEPRVVSEDHYEAVVVAEHIGTLEDDAINGLPTALRC